LGWFVGFGWFGWLVGWLVWVGLFCFGLVGWFGLGWLVGWFGLVWFGWWSFSVKGLWALWDNNYDVCVVITAAIVR
jgi:hypothetical protein